MLLQNDKIKILNHGHISFIEQWGSDERIVEAARMSTGKGFLGWGTPENPGDEKLLRFLHENHHDTPFEMGGMIIEVEAPIMVFREWHRHRTQSYNEMSARYTPLPNVAYLPTVDRVLINSATNRQAGTIKGADELTAETAIPLLEEERELLIKVEDLYQRKLKAGFPKELARTHLTVSRYSRMRACANLRNWLAFLTLRMDTKAQWEIRQYANAVGAFIQLGFPKTWELFTEKRT